MRHSAKILAALLATTALLVTACGGSDHTGATNAGGAAGSNALAGPVTVDITINNGDITPAGERVNATVGQTIKLNVSSDQEDEIHVHSQPEHEFEVKPGKEQTFQFKIERPGVYEVESHKTETLIMSIAVRP